MDTPASKTPMQIAMEAMGFQFPTSLADISILDVSRFHKIERALIDYGNQKREEALNEAADIFLCWQPHGPQPDECPGCGSKKAILALLQKDK